jgi:hypothetical protein
MTELYNLERGTWFKIVDKKVKVPVSHQELNTEEAFKFHHIDGMYSYCTDKDDNVVHLAAWTEVEEIV